MNTRDKLLYHQIHPLKLCVDLSTSAVSSILLWRHALWVGMLVAWIPSVLVTLAMLRWMDFEAQRRSAFGRYLARHMTRRAEGVRFLGQFVMWAAAWWHLALGIAAGAAVVVLGWTYSLPFPPRSTHGGGVG